MKSFALALYLISFSALADDFACHLQSGPFNHHFSGYSEYRVLNASVEGGTFICSGEIIGDVITVTISSTETGETNSISERSSFATVRLTALDQHGDGLDNGVCKCGME